MEHYVVMYSGVPEENWALLRVAILIRKQLKYKRINYTWILKSELN
jgi:hypothetical protein